MNDDHWARTVLADPEFGFEPPSKVDLMLAVRRGRRRLWARRTAVTAAGTGVAVIAVAAVPFAGSGTGTGTMVWGTLPQPSPSVSSATHPAPPPAPPTRCQREQMELPAGTARGLVYAGDPSGRYAVGVTGTGENLGPGELRLTLWDGLRPTVLDPPMNGRLDMADVNSAGTVALSIQTEAETRSWLYRDGRFTELLSPPGNRYAAVGINERGDVVGTSTVIAGVHPPAVWPAGSPANPRILSGGDPGDDMVAAAGGIDDDGTVVGTTRQVAVWDDRSGKPRPQRIPSRAVYWPASGGPARDLPIPAGFGPDGQASSIRGGMVAGDFQRPDPDADRRGNRAVIWDLRTGTPTVTLDDRLGFAVGINPHGWVVGRSAGPGDPAPPAAVLGGNLVLLPMPALIPDGGGGLTISDDGRIIVGFARVGEHSKPVRWICT